MAGSHKLGALWEQGGVFLSFSSRILCGDLTQCILKIQEQEFLLKKKKKKHPPQPGQRTKAKIKQKGDFVIILFYIVSKHIFLVHKGMPPPGHAGPWVEWQGDSAKVLAPANITPSLSRRAPQG